MTLKNGQVTPLPGLSLSVQLPDDVKEAFSVFASALVLQAQAIEELRQSNSEANALLTRLVASQQALHAEVAKLNRPRKRIPHRNAEGRIERVDEEIQ